MSLVKSGKEVEFAHMIWVSKKKILGIIFFSEKKKASINFSDDLDGIDVVSTAGLEGK